ARVYLTNALEPASDASHSQIDLLSAALANEVNAVNAIKRRQRLTVVMGNPPYSIQSANLNESARNLVEEYKSVDGERIRERNAKYEFLSAHSVKTTTWRALSPTSPFYLLDASEHGLAAEYLAWPSLRDIVVTFSSGMKTHKDRFAYAFTAKEMRDRLQEFVSSDVPGDLLRTEYGVKDTPLWSLAVAREKLR